MFNSLLSLLYPSLCLNCKSSTKELLFCEPCTSQIELLDPDFHCNYCFEALENSNLTSCEPCRTKQHFINKVGAVFPYESPVAALIKKLKYGQQGALADSIAAWMLIQWERLKWPAPDLIIPVPISWTKRLDRGFNQSYLIGKSLGKLMHIPVQECLKRQSASLSQAGLSKSQRLKQNQESFKFIEKNDIADKTILLLDDVMTTGKTLENCADALLEGHPSAIYALVFCRSFS